MGLQLSTEQVVALERRTEGWIAGLQLVSLSLQGHTDKTQFVQTFAGDNRYVLNFLSRKFSTSNPSSGSGIPAAHLHSAIGCAAHFAMR